MIANDRDDEWRANEKMTPIFKRADNGKEFFIVNVVVALGGFKLPTEKGNRMKYVGFSTDGRDRTAPIAKSEASVSTVNGRAGSG